MSTNGGPAFPSVEMLASGVHYSRHPGMTLRDYFAANALQGALAYPGCFIRDYHITEYAEFAYKIADAMLAERSKGDQT